MIDQPLPPSAETEIRALLQQRRKIHAIKLLREHTGLGLKEAKDRIDALDRELRPREARATGPSGSGGLFAAVVGVVLAILAWWWLRG
jgi:hypothetical protein